MEKKTGQPLAQDEGDTSLPTPFNSLDHSYWRQKLPHGFQFYMDRLARGILRVQPTNVPEFAAVFMEEMLVQRNHELSKLPSVSYFTKMDLQIVPRGSPAKPCKSKEEKKEATVTAAFTVQSVTSQPTTCCMPVEPLPPPATLPCDVCQRSDYVQAAVPVETGTQVDLGRETGTQCENILSLLHDPAVLCQHDPTLSSGTCPVGVPLGLSQASTVDGTPQIGYYKTTITSSGGVLTVSRETSVQLGSSQGAISTQNLPEPQTPPPSPSAVGSPGHLCDKCQNAISGSSVVIKSSIHEPSELCDSCLEDICESETQTSLILRQENTSQTSRIPRQETTAQTIVFVKQDGGTQTSNQKQTNPNWTDPNPVLCDECCEDLIMRAAAPTPPEGPSLTKLCTQISQTSQVSHPTGKLAESPKPGDNQPQQACSACGHAFSRPPIVYIQQRPCSAICDKQVPTPTPQPPPPPPPLQPPATLAPVLQTIVQFPPSSPGGSPQTITVIPKTTPQNVTVVPQTLAPQTLASAPQPVAAVPQATGIVPQITSTVPQTVAVVPQTLALVPQVTSAVSQSPQTISPLMLSSVSPIVAPVMAMQPCNMHPCPCAARMVCPCTLSARTVCCCTASVCSHAHFSQPHQPPPCQANKTCRVCKRPCLAASQKSLKHSESEDVGSDFVRGILGAAAGGVQSGKFPQPLVAEPESQQRQPKQRWEASSAVTFSPEPSQPSAVSSSYQTGGSSQKLGLASISQCERCQQRAAQSASSTCQCCGTALKPPSPQPPNAVCSKCGEQSIPLESKTEDSLCSKCSQLPQSLPEKVASGQSSKGSQQSPKSQTVSSLCSKCGQSPKPPAEVISVSSKGSQIAPASSGKVTSSLCSVCKQPSPEPAPSSLGESRSQTPEPAARVASEVVSSCPSTPQPPEAAPSQLYESCQQTPLPTAEEADNALLCKVCAEEAAEQLGLCQSCLLDEATERVCESCIQDADDDNGKTGETVEEQVGPQGRVFKCPLCKNLDICKFETDDNGSFIMAGNTTRKKRNSDLKLSSQNIFKCSDIGDVPVPYLSTSNDLHFRNYPRSTNLVSFDKESQSFIQNLSYHEFRSDELSLCSDSQEKSPVTMYRFHHAEYDSMESENHNITTADFPIRLRCLRKRQPSYGKTNRIKNQRDDRKVSRRHRHCVKRTPGDLNLSDDRIGDPRNTFQDSVRFQPLPVSGFRYKDICQGKKSKSLPSFMLPDNMVFSFDGVFMEKLSSPIPIERTCSGKTLHRGMELTQVQKRRMVFLDALIKRCDALPDYKHCLRFVFPTDSDQGDEGFSDRINARFGNQRQGEHIFCAFHNKGEFCNNEDAREEEEFQSVAHHLRSSSLYTLHTERNGKALKLNTFAKSENYITSNANKTHRSNRHYATVEKVGNVFCPPIMGLYSRPESFSGADKTCEGAACPGQPVMEHPSVSDIQFETHNLINTQNHVINSDTGDPYLTASVIDICTTLVTESREDISIGELVLEQVALSNILTKANHKWDGLTFEEFDWQTRNHLSKPVFHGLNSEMIAETVSQDTGFQLTEGPSAIAACDPLGQNLFENAAIVACDPLKQNLCEDPPESRRSLEDSRDHFLDLDSLPEVSDMRNTLPEKVLQVPEIYENVSLGMQTLRFLSSVDKQSLGCLAESQDIQQFGLLTSKTFITLDCGTLSGEDERSEVSHKYGQMSTDQRIISRDEHHSVIQVYGQFSKEQHSLRDALSTLTREVPASAAGHSLSAVSLNSSAIAQVSIVKPRVENLSRSGCDLSRRHLDATHMDKCEVEASSYSQDDRGVLFGRLLQEFTQYSIDEHNIPLQKHYRMKKDLSWKVSQKAHSGVSQSTNWQDILAEKQDQESDDFERMSRDGNCTVLQEPNDICSLSDGAYRTSSEKYAQKKTDEQASLSENDTNTMAERYQQPTGECSEGYQCDPLTGDRNIILSENADDVLLRDEHAILVQNRDELNPIWGFQSRDGVIKAEESLPVEPTRLSKTSPFSQSSILSEINAKKSFCDEVSMSKDGGEILSPGFQQFTEEDRQVILSQTLCQVVEELPSLLSEQHEIIVKTFDKISPDCVPQSADGFNSPSQEHDQGVKVCYLSGDTLLEQCNLETKDPSSGNEYSNFSEKLVSESLKDHALLCENRRQNCSQSTTDTSLRDQCNALSFGYFCQPAKDREAPGDDGCKGNKQDLRKGSFSRSGNTSVSQAFGSGLAGDELSEDETRTLSQVQMIEKHMCLVQKYNTQTHPKGDVLSEKRDQEAGDYDLSLGYGRHMFINKVDQTTEEYCPLSKGENSMLAEKCTQTPICNPSSLSEHGRDIFSQKCCQLAERHSAENQCGAAIEYWQEAVEDSQPLLDNGYDTNEQDSQEYIRSLEGGKSLPQAFGSKLEEDPIDISSGCASVFNITYQASKDTQSILLRQECQSPLQKRGEQASDEPEDKMSEPSERQYQPSARDRTYVFDYRSAPENYYCTLPQPFDKETNHEHSQKDESHPDNELAGFDNQPTKQDNPFASKLQLTMVTRNRNENDECNVLFGREDKQKETRVEKLERRDRRDISYWRNGIGALSKGGQTPTDPESDAPAKYRSAPESDCETSSQNFNKESTNGWSVGDTLSCLSQAQFEDIPVLPGRENDLEDQSNLLEDRFDELCVKHDDLASLVEHMNQLRDELNTPIENCPWMNRAQDVVGDNDYLSGNHRAFLLPCFNRESSATKDKTATTSSKNCGNESSVNSLPALLENWCVELRNDFVPEGEHDARSGNKKHTYGRNVSPLHDSQCSHAESKVRISDSFLGAELEFSESAQNYNAACLYLSPSLHPAVSLSNSTQSLPDEDKTKSINTMESIIATPQEIIEEYMCISSDTSRAFYENSEKNLISFLDLADDKSSEYVNDVSSTNISIQSLDNVSHVLSVDTECVTTMSMSEQYTEKSIGGSVSEARFDIVREREDVPGFLDSLDDFAFRSNIIKNSGNLASGEREQIQDNINVHKYDNQKSSRYDITSRHAGHGNAGMLLNVENAKHSGKIPFTRNGSSSDHLLSASFTPATKTSWHESPPCLASSTVREQWKISAPAIEDEGAGKYRHIYCSQAFEKGSVGDCPEGGYSKLREVMVTDTGMEGLNFEDALAVSRPRCYMIDRRLLVSPVTETTLSSVPSEGSLSVQLSNSIDVEFSGDPSVDGAADFDDETGPVTQEEPSTNRALTSCQTYSNEASANRQSENGTRERIDESQTSSNQEVFLGSPTFHDSHMPRNALSELREGDGERGNDTASETSSAESVDSLVAAQHCVTLAVNNAINIVDRLNAPAYDRPPLPFASELAARFMNVFSYGARTGIAGQFVSARDISRASGKMHASVITSVPGGPTGMLNESSSSASVGHRRSPDIQGLFIHSQISCPPSSAIMNATILTESAKPTPVENRSCEMLLQSTSREFLSRIKPLPSMMPSLNEIGKTETTENLPADRNSEVNSAVVPYVRGCIFGSVTQSEEPLAPAVVSSFCSQSTASPNADDLMVFPEILKQLPSSSPDDHMFHEYVLQPMKEIERIKPKKIEKVLDKQVRNLKIHESERDDIGKATTDKMANVYNSFRQTEDAVGASFAESFSLEDCENLTWLQQMFEDDEKNSAENIFVDLPEHLKWVESGRSREEDFPVADRLGLTTSGLFELTSEVDSAGNQPRPPAQCHEEYCSSWEFLHAVAHVSSTEMQTNIDKQDKRTQLLEMEHMREKNHMAAVESDVDDIYCEPPASTFPRLQESDTLAKVRQSMSGTETGFRDYSCKEFVGKRNIQTADDIEASGTCSRTCDFVAYGHSGTYVRFSVSRHPSLSKSDLQTKPKSLTEVRLDENVHVRDEDQREETQEANLASSFDIHMLRCDYPQTFTFVSQAYRSKSESSVHPGKDGVKHTLTAHTDGLHPDMSRHNTDTKVTGLAYQESVQHHTLEKQLLEKQKEVLSSQNTPGRLCSLDLPCSSSFESQMVQSDRSCSSADLELQEKVTATSPLESTFTELLDTVSSIVNFTEQVFQETSVTRTSSREIKQAKTITLGKGESSGRSTYSPACYTKGAKTTHLEVETFPGSALSHLSRHSCAWESHTMQLTSGSNSSSEKHFRKERSESNLTSFRIPERQKIEKPDSSSPSRPCRLSFSPVISTTLSEQNIAGQTPCIADQTLHGLQSDLDKSEELLNEISLSRSVKPRKLDQHVRFAVAESDQCCPAEPGPSTSCFKSDYVGLRWVESRFPRVDLFDHIPCSEDDSEDETSVSESEADMAEFLSYEKTFLEQEERDYKFNSRLLFDISSGDSESFGAASGVLDYDDSGSSLSQHSSWPMESIPEEDEEIEEECASDGDTCTISNQKTSALSYFYLADEVQSDSSGEPRLSVSDIFVEYKREIALASELFENHLPELPTSHTIDLDNPGTEANIHSILNQDDNRFSAGFDTESSCTGIPSAGCLKTQSAANDGSNGLAYVADLTDGSVCPTRDDSLSLNTPKSFRSCVACISPVTFHSISENVSSPEETHYVFGAGMKDRLETSPFRESPWLEFRASQTSDEEKNGSHSLDGSRDTVFCPETDSPLPAGHGNLCGSLTTLETFTQDHSILKDSQGISEYQDALAVSDLCMEERGVHSISTNTVATPDSPQGRRSSQDEAQIHFVACSAVSFYGYDESPEMSVMSNFSEDLAGVQRSISPTAVRMREYLAMEEIGLAHLFSNPFTCSNQD